MRAVFLDRDGVQNANIVREGKPYAPRSLETFELLPQVDQAVRDLKAAGFLCIVTTNQPDVASGLTPRTIVDAMHDRLRAELPLDDIKVCWHVDADRCSCRKPKPGLLLGAAQEYNVELDGSFMVGDRWRDILAGQAAGCFSILVDHGLKQDQECRPNAVVSSLIEAAGLILDRTKAKRPLV